MSVRRIVFDTWSLDSKSHLAAQGEFATLMDKKPCPGVEARNVHFLDDVVYACEERASHFIASVQKVWRVPVGIKVSPYQERLDRLDIEISVLESQIGSIWDGNDANVALCNWFSSLVRHQDELMSLREERRKLVECNHWHWLVGSWRNAA